MFSRKEQGLMDVTLNVLPQEHEIVRPRYLKMGLTTQRRNKEKNLQE